MDKRCIKSQPDYIAYKMDAKASIEEKSRKRNSQNLMVMCLKLTVKSWKLITISIKFPNLKKPTVLTQIAKSNKQLIVLTSPTSSQWPEDLYLASRQTSTRQ